MKREQSQRCAHGQHTSACLALVWRVYMCQATPLAYPLHPVCTLPRPCSGANCTDESHHHHHEEAAAPTTSAVHNDLVTSLSFQFDGEMDIDKVRSVCMYLYPLLSPRQNWLRSLALLGSLCPHML